LIYRKKKRFTSVGQPNEVILKPHEHSRGFEDVFDKMLWGIKQLRGNSHWTCETKVHLKN